MRCPPVCPGFLVPCANGNSRAGREIKIGDELWVNCQGKGALPWAHPSVSRAGEMTHGVH